MKMSFRWYGKDDPVSLEYIRQIPGMENIVTAYYDAEVGQAWKKEDLEDIFRMVEENNLSLEVIESVPVHEDIKLGLESRDQYIENYKKTIRILGELGVKVICYNFMPVFDWTRSTVDESMEDGSKTLAYYEEDIARMDPLSGELSLPGWDISYKNDEIVGIFERYKSMDQEDFWDNLSYFLERIIPVAEESGIKMAIHPDDPPWPIFGLPRIINNEEHIDRFLKIVDSTSNGLTFCTGSLASGGQNDLLHLLDKYSAMGRIHFMHVRNVENLDGRSFRETAHPSAYGSLDMVRIMEILYENSFDGYLRPDHGRMIWGEEGRPGYGLYDRALGATYIYGIWETLGKTKER